MKNFFQVSCVVLASTVFVISCKKENEKVLTSGNQNRAISGSLFLPNTSIQLMDGHLSFSSFESLDSFVISVGNSDPNSVNLWERSIGFESQRRIFSETVNAEDSIDNLFESGHLKGNQILSSQLNRALNLGVIDYKTDYDGTRYWSLVTRFDFLKSVLNSDGLIEIDGKLHKYYSNGTIKIANNNEFDVNQFDAISIPNDDVTIIETPPENVIYEPLIDRGVTTPYECISIFPNAANDSYTKTNNWQTPENKRRVKLELYWYSAKNFSQQDCQRFRGIQVNFYVRTYAQKKNFWGNWVFSNYNPSLNLKVNSRNYNFSTNMSCLAPAIIRSNYLPILNNALMPGQNYFTYTNNGTIPLNPHYSGWYVFSSTTTEMFKCPAFLNNFSISANFAGKTNWGLE